MEQKNKLVLSLLIALVIIVAMLSSFGLNLFVKSGAEIVLPTPLPSGAVVPGGENDPDTSGLVQKVEVDRQTVQSVIATLARPGNYARTVTVEMSTGESQSGNFTAEVLVDGNWTSVQLTQDSQPMGKQHTIVNYDPKTGTGTLYRWYARGVAVKSWPVGKDGPDLAQHMPTYEDVLKLEPDAIVEAGFVARDGIPCVYVQTSVGELGYLERYWVSTDSGLLVAAETAKGDQVVMRMSASEADVLQAVGDGETWFTLPDGTVLHQMSAHS